MQNLGRWEGRVYACMCGWGLFLGEWGKEMPSAALLWGVEELGKPTQWLCASLPHGRKVQVCTFLSWWGGVLGLFILGRAGVKGR